MAAGVYRVTVPPEWIDYNHHLTEGYYGVAFADAGDALLLEVGFDDAYRQDARGTFYTAEAHIRFKRDVAEGAELTITSTVLGADARRLHLLHVMTVDDVECAVQESMLLHVDADTGRVAPMASAIGARLQALADSHAARERPEWIGAGIRGMPAP